MSDFITMLATKSGVDLGMAQRGMGALLSTLQQHVPADIFSKVSDAIPGAKGLLSSFQTGNHPGASPLDLAGTLGGLLGGKSEAFSRLVSQFGRAGFSLDTARSFLPAAIGLLKDRLPPEVMKQVEGAIPGLSNLLSGTEGGSPGTSKDLF